MPCASRGATREWLKHQAVKTLLLAVAVVIARVVCEIGWTAYIPRLDDRSELTPRRQTFRRVADAHCPQVGYRNRCGRTEVWQRLLSQLPIPIKDINLAIRDIVTSKCTR